MLEKGEGSPIDITEALHWYGKAAQQQVPEAQLRLGDCYMAGRGITQDPDIARSWYERAAALGNAEAVIRLNQLPGKASTQPQHQARDTVAMSS